MKIICINTILPFWPRTRVKTTIPRDMKFTNLVKGFLVNKIINSVFFHRCLGVKNEILEIMVKR